ncbi:P-loop containing nucleoside triphosphate hydrolase protein [Aspergillus steynii IBT 23096]|uniref:P-loop containing nucleoside triphosphate hydrolase protein n=1 Tax=Aspergillus steynii IBT 23096 TaxID=1392250 RepID=A0A2I2FSL5_9EURO|nr:P-loop containing nucleoside triphosphate hydrolase protein [Aspergillus steynii IBT 23096]PLB43601.1 P-loop containing nucleoside triphosphate hydrolase protein [Aspergillus steynii IBT 23096]
MAENNTIYWTESSFGPTDSDRFDFTPLFENTILSILPSVIFVILTPQRLLWLTRQPRKVNKNWRSFFKLGVITVYNILQLSVLLYWTAGPLKTTKAQIAAAALALVSGVVLLGLSYTEHTRSVRPSTLIDVYLLFTLIFDCAIVRTSWTLQGRGIVAKLLTSTVAIKCLILVMEGWEKRGILYPQYRCLSPEATSGIYSRSIFWWLNPLMKIGFDRFITYQDLYPIDDNLAAKSLLTKIENAWNSANQAKNNSLFWLTLWTTKSAFISGIFARVCLIAFKYTQPFLIERTVGFGSDLSQPESIGWGLTGAWFLVFVGLAISTGAFYHATYRLVTSVRGSLVSLVYSKTLDLSVTALDESVAVTLMSTDSENICQGFANLHEVWAAPVECAVALFLLYRQLEMAFLAPMVVAIIATFGIMGLAKYMGNAQKTWVRAIQTRVDVTASMLASMKEVKMLGLTDTLTEKVQNLRVSELRFSKWARKLLCLRVLLGSSLRTIAPLATFATFVILSNSTGKPLDTASAYSSLSLIYLLADPMATMIRTIPMISTAMACFDRIQAFLLSESCKDHRLPLSESSSNLGSVHSKPTAPNTATNLVELRPLADARGLRFGDPLMIITNACFGWTDSEPKVLDDISCTIRKGQFTFIVGSVGSGKSSLVKLMLGEIRPSKGFVYTGIQDIAYAGQTPWIQNMTLRANIIGVSSYDDAWYNKVAQACALEKDIMDLPNGDYTKVGTGGVSLSGGQKQRLALARVVYSKKEIVFLDDVFAGQDAATEEHIHQMLFANRGLFRQMGTTVVCITNAIHRLSHADHVIALSDRGRVLHQGSFEKLQTDTDFFEDLNVKQNGTLNADSDLAMSSTSQSGITRPHAVDEEVESSKRMFGELAIYGYYFGSMPAWHSLLLVAMVILHGGGYKMTELLLSFWTGHAVIANETTNNFYVGLYGLLSGLAVLGIIGAAVLFLIFMVPHSSEVLHARLLKTVMEAPLSFFTRTDIGVTTNRFSQDMSVVDTELPFALIDLCLNLAIALFAAVLMCVFSGYFAAIFPFVLFLCWLLQKFYLRTSRQVRVLDLEAKSPLFTQFLETLLGLSTVRAFGWERNFQENHLELLDASQRPYYLLFCIQRWLALVLDLMVAAMATILMVLVVKLRSQFAPQFVGLALLNVTSFNESLALIIKGWTMLETSFGAIARLKQFCGETETENLPLEVSPVPEGWPLHGHISIKNMTASYSPASEPVLHSIDLDIPAGFKVGICGRSGSGKSSLIACLLRMIELSPESSIKIDGIDIATLPRQAVRSMVAVVPQHPFFLKQTSVRENLTLQGQRNDEEIHTVLRRLKLEDLVKSMGGLDAVLDVERLSQGQCQFFCLARAMLSNKKIILLDEASSNVDEKSEMLIRKAVREQFAGCTVIAIAHRLGAVVDFDRVVVMDSGRIIEWDEPGALLQRDSYFKRLWDLGSG